MNIIHNQDKKKVADRNKCTTITAQQHEIPSTIFMTKETRLTKSANLEQDEENYGNAADAGLKKIIISNNMDLSGEASHMKSIDDEMNALDYEQFVHQACLNSSRVDDVEEACTVINILEEEGAGDCLLTVEKKTNLERRKYNSLSTINEAENEVAENNTEKTSAKESNQDKSLKLLIWDKKSLTVSPKPACSSKGFENTFSILQQQVVGTHEESIHNAFQNVEGFELEYLARERLLGLWNELDKIVTQKFWNFSQERMKERLFNISAPSLLPFLYDFTMAKEVLPKNYRTVSEHNKFERLKLMCHVKRDQNNIRYHASVDANGKKCLHVLRPPRTLNDERVLCGNRVSQMTRAYDDIEAVTRLLEEKEKDLELTVQIGKELLTQNNQLESRVSELESELKSANDDRSQLLHELHKKNELIAVLTNEDGSEAETPTLSKSITVDLLQKKITTLEDENKSLRMETTQLVNETDEIEAQERKLMEDLTCQLNDANGQFEGLSLELERQREENRLQHEQIVSLTARLSEAEMRLHQLTNDNDEHITLLNITKENQNSLALELVEFKQRYQEVLALLHEAQEQLRKHRKRIMPQARSTYLNCVGVSGAGSGLLQPDSLQSELMETSLYSENSLDSGIAGDYNSLHKRLMSMSQLSGAASTGGLLYGGGNAAVPPYKRVFETVRCATKVGTWSDGLSSGDDGPVVSLNSGPRMSVSTIPPGSYYGGGGGGGMGAKTYSYESLLSEQGEGYPSQPAGVPGAPGAKDLEIALKRLSPAEVLARRAMLTYAPLGSYNYDEQTQQAPGLLGVRTPDSIMSTGSSGISSHASAAHMSSSSQQHWRLPEKLQIVKPLEGSQTLHHWTRLATPTLSGLLDERPGVAIRGGRGLDELGMQLYTLSDVEEDIVTEDLPGKQFEGAGCTYTYTTSHVMHPAEDGFTNDLTFLSQSQISSRMASASTSRQPSCPPTPHAGMSRKNSCSTFSVNTGLASMLNERGIKAVTPSALNTPAGPNFTPTVTPCNSPEGSPTRSRSPEPYFGGILSTGADLIRRKLIGIDLNERRMMRSQDKLKQQQQKIMLSRLERRALRSLKLVEKVESIGLENIIAASHMSPDGSFSSTGSSGIISRSSSPMSNLRQLQANANNIVDDLHFDRQHIKGVLHKGLRESNNMNKSTHVADIRSDDSDTSDDGLIMHKIQKRKANSSSSITASPSTTATTDSSTKTAIDLKSKSNATTAANTNTVALPSATEGRLKSMQRQKSRRQLKNGLASAQRPDLGTINGAGGSGVRSDLGKVMAPSTSSTAAAETSRNTQHTDSAKEQQIQKMNIEQQASQSITQAFVGSISSLLFGRKGGWL